MVLCFATQNRHKLQEIQAMLPAGITLMTPAELGCMEELPETQLTLEGNSAQKADYLFENYQVDCFADDTGLEIEALNGAPGVFSAMYACKEKNAEANMKLVLENLRNQNNRKARFRTVITLVLNGRKEIFEGILEGEILQKPIGTHGFGYDPIFMPKGFTQTLAEMTMEEKNKISHRSLAFKKLREFLAPIVS
jgi:XTP/dITP diphosphohydrolase